MNKTCSKCGVDKPLDAFHKNKLKKDGHDIRCKKCVSIIKSEWYQDNKNKKKQYNQEYYKDNTEYYKEYNKQWINDNRDEWRSFFRKRRAKKKQVRENFTPEQEYLVRSMFQNKCFNCALTEEEHQERWNQTLHVDHIQPLSKGYALSPVNACLLCRRCNSTKNNKNPEEFFSSYQLDLLNRYREYLLLPY